MKDSWQHGCVRDMCTGDDDGPLVLKLGGSLLGLRDWPWLIDAIVTAAGDRPLSIVVGGGSIVDGLRAIDAAARQETKLMHDLAVDAMHLTARIVSQRVGLPISAKPARAAHACVLDVPLWLLENDHGSRLPIGWHVTSDSIAAHIADRCDAGLLLAKPVPPPSGSEDASLESLAGAGWVDPFFPTAAARLDQIKWAAPAP